MRGKFPTQHRQLPRTSKASMRPAHCAREVHSNAYETATGTQASMRPAHCAREVPTTPPPAAPRRCRFNEARALCAGSCFKLNGRPALLGSFNEARALCAGSFEEKRQAEYEKHASMRPAHCAREVHF